MNRQTAERNGKGEKVVKSVSEKEKDEIYLFYDYHLRVDDLDAILKRPRCFFPGDDGRGW